MEGWLFDLYTQPNGQMIIWLKKRNSDTVKLVDHWRPSFYVAGTKGDLDLLSSRLGIDHRIEEWYEHVESFSKSPVLRIFYDSKRDCDRIRNQILRLGEDLRYRLYNLDIPHDQLYLYERDLFPLAHVEADQLSEGIKWKLLDSAYDIDYPLPLFKTLELEVVAAADSRSFPKFNDPLERINLRCENESFSINSGSEEDKLLGLMDHFESLDPDIIVTQYGDSFQLPYLGWRAKANNLSHRFFLGRETMQRVPEKRDGQSYFSYGRVYYRSGPVRLMGRFHLDLENAFIYDDCGLSGLFEISRCCRIPLPRASRSTIGTSMTSLQIYTAYRDRVLIPWRKETPEDFKTINELLTADRGGFIVEPKTGLHENVGELDYSSLYPMLMLTRNISPETIRCSCCPDSIERVPELGYNICRRRTGIVPKSLEILLKKRQAYKRLSKTGQVRLRKLYKQRADALKWILVCCLPYDSPVLVSQDGKISYQQIGKMVDQQLGDAMGVFDCSSELFVAGVDKNLRSRFCRVSKLIKTLSPERLLQVKMDDGRQVKCTSNHSFYVLRDGHLIEVKAGNLSKGDLVPVAKRIVHNPAIWRLNLLEELRRKTNQPEEDVWRAKSNGLRSIVESSSSALEVVLRNEGRHVQNIGNWRKNGIVPFRYLHLLLAPEESKEILIGRGRILGGHQAWLPSSLDLDEELGFFLGFYVADGSAGENFIRLDVGGNEPEIVDHLSKIISSKFGLTPRVYKETKANMFVVQVNSISLVQILNRIFELSSSSSTGKLKVPPLLFNASQVAIIGFLSGLVAGDGSVNKDRNHVSIATQSYDFAVQIGYLALHLGIPFNILKGQRLHRIYFSGPNAFFHFKKPFLKKSHRTIFDRFKTTCHADCRHALFEMFPVEESGLRKIATFSRTVRTPRLEGRIRVCPERARESLRRISRSSRFPDVQEVYSRIEKLLYSDIGFVAVKEVDQIAPSSPHVYCFEISEEEENFPAFFTGAGGVLVHNSFGYLGFKNARFGKIDAHISVCAFSRDILRRTETLVRERGYRVLHAIVDSTWLQHDDATTADYEELARDLGKHFSLPLSFEGVYRWIVFLPSKVHPNRPVLNRYYGVFSDGELKVRGIAIRRHDTPKIVENLQVQILELLGRAKNINEFKKLLPDTLKILHHHIDLAKSGSIPAGDLVIRKNISKEPSQYSNKVPQAIAAVQLNEHGFEVASGQTVGYVLLKGNQGTAQRVVAEGLADRTVEYDVDGYCSLLIDAFAEILSPLGFEKEKLSSLPSGC